MKRKSKNRQILLGAVIVLSVVLILLIAALFWLKGNDPGHNGGAVTEQTAQLPEGTAEVTKGTEQPPEQTTQPLEQTNQPPEQTTQPPEQTTQPPEQTTQPPEQTTRPPEQTTRPPEQTTRPPEQTTQPPEDPSQTPPSIKVPVETEPVYEDVQVQTAYCDLFYSGQWADSIRTERIAEDFGETVLFYGTADGKETALFAVYFAGATDNSFPVGVYSTADGLTVDISAEIFELENKGWTDADFDQICAMQEQVNYVLEKLEETAQTEPPIKVPEETEPVYKDVQVQTAYCDLIYSGQWADSIRTERIAENFAETVLFYGTAEGKETVLFAVCFAGATDNSFPVGVYLTADGLTVDISAEIFEVENKGWTDAGFDQICAMQEQINYVIMKLAETEGFTRA